MLDSGLQVLGCQVEELVASNSVYDTYSVTAADGTRCRLLLFFSEDLKEKSRRQSATALVARLEGQDFAQIALPLGADEVSDHFVCLWPDYSGPALSDLDDLPLPTDRALALVRQIAAALIAPHIVDFTHGALSPQNVRLLDHDVLLFDFALGKIAPLDFNSGIDPQCISPEQVRGEAYGQPADVYALGCILYFLLTGTPPFNEKEPFYIAVQRLHEKFPKLPDSLQQCQSLLDRMVAALPEQRPDAAQIVAEIDQLLEIWSATVQDTMNSDEAGGQRETDVVAEVDEFLSSDIAAKIEARLMALEEGSAPAEAPDKADLVQQGADAANLNFRESGRRDSRWRPVFLLLLGVVIGVVVYALYSDQPSGSGGRSVTAEDPLLSELQDAIGLWRNQETQAAVVRLLGLIQDYPDDPRAYNDLAAIRVAQGNYEEARALLERAMNTSSDYATVYNNLAAIYSEMARVSYGRALQLTDEKRNFTLALIPQSQGPSVVLPEAALNDPDAVSEVAPVSEPQAVAVVAAEKAAPVQPPVVQPEKVATPVTPPAELPRVASEPEPKQMPQQVSSNSFREEPPSADLSAVETFLASWAEAWSRQDVDAYLAHYAGDFIPRSGVARERWEQQRRSRLANPSAIQVTLENFTLVKKTDDLLTVDVEQVYVSDVYSDLTRKRFELRKLSDGFEIVRENSLEVIR